MVDSTIFKHFMGPLVPALLTTRSENGAINVAPSAWITKVSIEPPLVAVAQRHGSDTLRNMEREPLFGMSVMPTERSHEVVLCGQKVPYGDCELFLPGVQLKPIRMPNEWGVVLIRDALQVAVGEVRQILDVGGDHKLVIAELKMVNVDMDRLGDVMLHWCRRKCAVVGQIYEVSGY